MAQTITIDWDSADNDFDTIYDLIPGEVFKFTKDIETLHQKIADRVPITLTTFKVKVITPGSPYFTMYGVNSMVVVERVVAPVPE